ncbi:MAG: acyltransferase domain-containing protein [Abditibacteriaceae bacterium]
MVQTITSKFKWVLDITAVETLLRKLQIRDEVINYVCRASREVAQAENLPEFFEFCGSWQEHVKQQTADNYSPRWQVLAIVSSFPEVIENHRARGVSWEITRATLADFQRDTRIDNATEKLWKFNRLSWMCNHVSGNLFEIGRLQYIPEKFGYKFRIYKNSESGEIISLALPGLHCTSQGLLCDDATAFETILEENEEGIVGHPVLANGIISSIVQKIPATSKVLLDADSTVAIIHIPSGSKLDRADCCQSLRDASDFFKKYFPDIQIRAFCTCTWLLDPELRKILPADSNIASFGALFLPLTITNANDGQLRERVFDNAEWEQSKAENSLQKAILNHHKNGGEFRSAAGFILPEEIESYSLQNVTA